MHTNSKLVKVKRVLFSVSLTILGVSNLLNQIQLKVITTERWRMLLIMLKYCISNNKSIIFIITSSVALVQTYIKEKRLKSMASTIKYPLIS